MRFLWAEYADAVDFGGVNGMIDLLDMHKQLILRHLGAGDTAADFTMGNGNDTEFLCRTVGNTGHVYAFDVQTQALGGARRRLEQACLSNYTLICDSHENLKAYIHTPVKAGMFNLGYLPGSGRKEFTTCRESTLKAVHAAVSILDEDAVLLVAVYPGHAEGAAEGEALAQYFAGLDRRKMCVSKVQIVNSPAAPYFFALETK